MASGRLQLGFSLFELLTVLAIMGIVFAIAAPRYGTSLDRYRVDAAAGRVEADLIWARTLARTENRRVVVKFDPGNDRYWFDDEPDPDQPGQDYTVHLTDSPYQAALVSASFDGNKNVGFNRFGVIVTHDKGKPLAGDGQVVVGAGGFQRTIVVDRSTGKARVQ